LARLRRPFERAVDEPPCFPRAARQRRGIDRRACSGGEAPIRDCRQHRLPQPVHEAARALDARLAPQDLGVRRREEEHREARHADAVLLEAGAMRVSTTQLFRKSVAGETPCPFDFDIVSPSASATMPWWTRRVAGSSTGT